MTRDHEKKGSSKHSTLWIAAVIIHVHLIINCSWLYNYNLTGRGWWNACPSWYNCNTSNSYIHTSLPHIEKNANAKDTVKKKLGLDVMRQLPN